MDCYKEFNMKSFKLYSIVVLILLAICCINVLFTNAFATGLNNASSDPSSILKLLDSSSSENLGTIDSSFIQSSDDDSKMNSALTSGQSILFSEDNTLSSDPSIKVVVNSYFKDGINGGKNIDVREVVGSVDVTDDPSNIYGVTWNKDEGCAVFDGEAYFIIENPLIGANAETGFTISMEVFISSQNNCSGKYIWSKGVSAGKRGWQRLFDLSNGTTQKYFFINAGPGDVSTASHPAHLRVAATVNGNGNEVRMNRSDSKLLFYDAWHTLSLIVKPGGTMELYIDGTKISNCPTSDKLKSVLNVLSSYNTCYIGTSVFESTKSAADGFFYGKIRGFQSVNSSKAFKISYESNGGTACPSISTPVIPSTLPQSTKEGYTLEGWYNEPELLTKAEPEKPLTQDITLYAKWENNVTEINFDDNGGIGGPDASVIGIYDQSLPSIIQLPTKTGYTFEGYYDASDKQYYNDEGVSVCLWDKDVRTYTLIAKWKNNITEICFDDNGGIGGPDASVIGIYDQSLPAITQLPTKTGYTFEGYYDASDKQYYNDEGVSVCLWDKDVRTYTLIAKWKNNATEIGFDDNGGIGGPDASVIGVYDQSLPAITQLPTKTGYTFEGYYDASDKQYYNVEGVSVCLWDKDVRTYTLIAKLNPIVYHVVFSSFNGGTINGELDQYSYYGGHLKDVPDVTANAGYYFEGWICDKDIHISNIDPSEVFLLSSEENNVTTIPAGQIISSEQLSRLIIEDNLSIGAIFLQNDQPGYTDASGKTSDNDIFSASAKTNDNLLLVVGVLFVLIMSAYVCFGIKKLNK